MRDSSETQTEAIRYLLAIVEAISRDHGTEEWRQVVAERLRAYSRELDAIVPARLVDACGGDELTARRILTVLERATRYRAGATLEEIQTALDEDATPGKPTLARAARVRFPDV